MEQLHYSIVINAPKQKVWETMLEDATYRQWTEVFNPAGSYYEGEWTTGSKMLFLGPNPDPESTVSGMVARIEESRPYDFVSIRHLGEIIKGEENLWPVVEGQEPYENYTLREVEGGTEVLVDLNILSEYKDMFNDMWPKALEKLKEIAEG